MRIISEARLREFYSRPGCRDAEQPIRAWRTHVRRATWENFGQLRNIYASADVVGDCVVFNIGNNVEITIGDLAKQVREMCASKSEIVYIPYEKAYEQGFEDMPRRVPDLSKIKNTIGWLPTIALPQILNDVIEHQRRAG